MPFRAEAADRDDTSLDTAERRAGGRAGAELRDRLTVSVHSLSLAGAALHREWPTPSDVHRRRRHQPGDLVLEAPDGIADRELLLEPPLGIGRRRLRRAGRRSGR